MSSEQLVREIQTFKTQIGYLLSHKYVDQSMLLGIHNMVQSKFQALILEDLNGYYDKLKEGEQADFGTIRFFEEIWEDFHYPSIKFFQFQHAAYYNEYEKNIISSQKPLKTVEIRKIHAYFLKFFKQTHEFYFNLMKYFSTHYCNELIPRSFLRNFKFVVPKNAIDSLNITMKANVVYLIHRCLLLLGNLSRYRSFIEALFVEPCLSVKRFWKHYKSAHQIENGNAYLDSQYETALNYYKFCILLLPALNESYNHVGVIHSLSGHKFEACYWFLRSHFTRLLNRSTLQTNLTTLLKKDYFLDTLKKTYFGTKNNRMCKSDELNYQLVCLICYYYLPEKYRLEEGFIIKSLKYKRLEKDFFDGIFGSFDELFGRFDYDGLDYFSKQLVVLVAFHGLIQQLEDKRSEVVSFNNFVFLYINNLLKAFRNSETNDRKDKIFVVPLRLMLNWFKENKNILKSLKSKIFVEENLAGLFNRLLATLKDYSKENPYYLNDTLHSLRENTRPKRDYYFVEDVVLKDFLLINYQFKDFKDDNLFNSSNVDLLDGNFRSLMDGNKIPLFLNEEIRKKLSDLDRGNKHKKVDFEVSVYEFCKRTQSSAVLLQKILDLNHKRFTFDEKQICFKKVDSFANEGGLKKKDGCDKRRDIYKKGKAHKKDVAADIDEKASQRKVDSGKLDDDKLSKSAAVSMGKVLGIEIPTSLEEINSAIAGHTSILTDKIMQKPNDFDRLKQDNEMNGMTSKSTDMENPLGFVAPNISSNNLSLGGDVNFLRAHASDKGYVPGSEKLPYNTHRVNAFGTYNNTEYLGGGGPLPCQGPFSHPNGSLSTPSPFHPNTYNFSLQHPWPQEMVTMQTNGPVQFASQGYTNDMQVQLVPPNMGTSGNYQFQNGQEWSTNLRPPFVASGSSYAGPGPFP